jgi:hypothetical protein
MYLCVVENMLGMASIVHHVDKDFFLKGNIEPEPDKVNFLIF